jgi:hypothetical protein
MRHIVLPVYLIITVIVCLYVPSGLALAVKEYAIEVSVVVQESPPRITLNWLSNSDELQYVISRKSKNASTWTQLAILPATSVSYVDTNVTVGGTYEYSLTKYPEPPAAVSGYIFAGIKAPFVDDRGKLLLIVDNTYATDLSTELSQFQQNLAGDGWTVIRHNVSRLARPPDVKAIIQTEYASDPTNVRCVFLFGHIPVPYSGNYTADDHDDHKGAWPADVYYGDMDGSWTDSSVNTTIATRPENHNVPGDGKFDQSTLPSNLELQVGRVDLANMPAFLPKTEKDLLRQYLQKNNDFRHRRFNIQRRGIVFDTFGDAGGEANGASGWRNFAPFFGPANITEIGWGEFFPTIQSQPYLWTYLGSGGGDLYNDCYGVGETVDFASNHVRTVFTMLFGSYFGDWDTADNFLRAPLCSTNNALTSIWAGRPQWFLHHMALGETIGYSTRLNQNNSVRYVPNYNARQVHMALMGDPTLRMHMVIPPSNLRATPTNGSVKLTWNASTDSDLQGYHVYRSTSSIGPFARLSTSLVASNIFSDTVAGGGTFTYMVRAIKLETSSSGTYYNPSQGVFITSTIPQTNSPVIISQLEWSTNQFRFRCSGVIGQRYAIDTSTNLLTWMALGTNTLSAYSYSFTNPTIATGRRFYRTRLVP